MTPRRRAIKVAEDKEPESLKAFKDVFGNYPVRISKLSVESRIGFVAQVEVNRLWKRLESEGMSDLSHWHLSFIYLSGFVRFQEDMENLSIEGLVDNTKATKKRKDKKRKNIRKGKYVFVKSSRQTQLYHNYFDPDIGIQMRLWGVGVSDWVRVLSTCSIYHHELVAKWPSQKTETWVMNLNLPVL